MTHIFSQIDDRNELAWHILDSGLMHDPDLADLVARGREVMASIPASYAP